MSLSLTVIPFPFPHLRAQGGELASALARNPGAPYSEGNVHDYAKQLASALAHVHEKQVIHGDLSVRVGSHGFLPPEVFLHFLTEGGSHDSLKTCCWPRAKKPARSNWADSRAPCSWQRKIKTAN